MLSCLLHILRQHASHLPAAQPATAEASLIGFTAGGRRVRRGPRDSTEIEKGNMEHVFRRSR